MKTSEFLNELTDMLTFVAKEAEQERAFGDYVCRYTINRDFATEGIEVIEKIKAKCVDDVIG